ncbi:hypothetical protein SD71_03400 [Cohnella kolymensis]|uniref:Uncharacterized protein n=1 Tax=Cohnella kolymensis TaxID=1590652 RepID=A0ABR5A9J2_9BACL|nr:hypothetical protein [Cohnella kolymensis]KIL37654.1 hypothetical protein SD71_03400 [Cohnella kolymensis]
MDEALQSLEQRADAIGKVLGKKRSVDLTGSKEKKLRSSGIRIIYIISNDFREVEVLQIVEVLLVDFKRKDYDVYRDALERLQRYWRDGLEDKEDGSLYWNLNEDNPIDLNEPSMIDQIFNENFDNLDEEIKDKIIELFNHGDVIGAYEIWRDANGQGF